MLLIAAAIRLASPPRPGSAPSLHPASPASSLCPLRFFPSIRSRGVCTHTRVRAHIPPIHPPVFIHTYTPTSSKSTHPPAADPSADPRKRSVHVNDRPPRPLSFPPHLRTEWAQELCNGGVQKGVSREREEKKEREIERGGRGEKENEREKTSSSELCAARDEIFALSSAKYWVRVRGSARRERWKKAGARKREGLLEVEKG